MFEYLGNGNYVSKSLLSDESAEEILEGMYTDYFQVEL